MIQDQWDDLEHLKRPDHIKQVWAEIERSFPAYFKLYSEGNALRAGALFGGTPTTVSPKSFLAYVKARLVHAFTEHSKQAEKYEKSLSLEALEEWESDKRGFAQTVERDIPVIHKAVHSSMDEMKVWKMKYQNIKKRHPERLYGVFRHLADLAEEYGTRVDGKKFGKFDTLGGFGFSDLDNGVEDEADEEKRDAARREDGLLRFGKYHILGVISLGITSTVLYYKRPDLFPHRGRQGLIGLYFLSGQKTFALPSGTSEFQMIKVSDNDSRMEHNFYYPYSPFALYSNRLARLLERELVKLGGTFDEDKRFVYTDDFLNFVTEHHAKDIAGWREPSVP